MVELALDVAVELAVLDAAAHSAALTRNVESGNSEIALAWSMWWVISTTFTADGAIPRSRSCAEAACSGFIWMPLKVICESRPRLACGLAATEG